MILLSLKRNYISKIIENLKARFPYIKLLNSFKIFNSKEFLKIDTKDDLYEEKYGEIELEIILNHFGKDKRNSKGKMLNSVIFKVDALAEWQRVRCLLWEKYRNLDTNKAWGNLCIDCYEGYPNILKLISLVLTLPISTVYCERGFSYLNITKNKIRNKLSHDNVDNLLLIMLESENIEEFDFSKAYNSWNDEENRLIHLKNS